jgi:hypothetical protein
MTYFSCAATFAATSRNNNMYINLFINKPPLTPPKEEDQEV